MAQSDEQVIAQQAEALEYARNTIVEMEDQLARLLSKPLLAVTVLKAKNEFNPDVFEENDPLLVLDNKVRAEVGGQRMGRVASKIDKNGFVQVKFTKGQNLKLNVGLKDHKAQVKLLGKDDGTNATIVNCGKMLEVHGLPGVKLQPCDTVMVNIDTCQIYRKEEVSSHGRICHVHAILDDGEKVEIEGHGGSTSVAIVAVKEKLEVGDRVMVDPGDAVVIRKLEKEGSDLYSLKEQQTIGWSDIAGVKDVKEELVQCLEMPYKFPEIFEFYNKKHPKGILLWGPPGNGKTLIAKAIASMLANAFGKEHMQSGFLYVKGPEILNKYVGEAERQVRSLFAQGKKHHEKHNYPCTLFIDEADALLMTRGSGKSSDVEKTIVPMFLSEMDGLEESRLMVILATNQQKAIDPAILREGRVDLHLRIPRPTFENALEYFAIHMRKMPVVADKKPQDLAAIAVAELFSKNRKLYQVATKNQTLDFKLSDCVSGSMIAGIVEMAKSFALRRDLKSGKRTGVTPQDFQDAIDTISRRHSELNPKFDLEDFCELKGIELCDAKVTHMRDVA